VLALAFSRSHPPLLSNKVALVKTGIPMEIVLNRESKRKTPTVVTIKKGERNIGEDAVALVRPANHASL